MRKKTIPITIFPSFWLIAFLIGWMSSASFGQILIWVGIVLVSVLIHEFGHALSALYFGQRAHIELQALGGATIRQGGKLSLAKEFVVVLMGPVFGLLFAACAFIGERFFESSFPGVAWQLLLIVRVNIIWTALNLLPVHPLDGGKLMAILFESIFGYQGIRVSYILSGVVASIFFLFFIWEANVWPACIFMILAFESFRSWSASKLQVSEKEEMKVLTELEKAEDEWEKGLKQESIDRLESLYKTAPKGSAFVEATLMLAHNLLSLGRTKEAYERLQSIKERLTPEGLRLFQLACYQMSDFREALQSGEKAYIEEGGGADAALLNAFSAARLGNAESSIGWLRCARKEGLDLTEALKTNDFDLIRSNPAFQRFSNHFLESSP
jgi:stage IV sporulation protein FB